MFLHLDCRYYRGDRPCKFHRLCEGCPHYEPMGPRVLIIKLGALGDVVRTQALVPGLARMFGEPPWVVWLTSPAAVDLVKRMPGVNEVMAFGAGAISALREQHFDAVICLDKEAEPCSVAMAVPARSRLGVGLSRYGTPFPLNDEAEYYFRLGLDNEEKFFRNTKSYQQLMYEAVGLEYRGERYEIEPTQADRDYAEYVFDRLKPPAIDPEYDFLPQSEEEKAAGIIPRPRGWCGTMPAEFEGEETSEAEPESDPKPRIWVGINPGAGKVFAYKAWREEGYVELIRELAERRPEVGCLLLGGNEEADLIERIRYEAGTRNVYSAGTGHSLGAFTAIIDRCDVLVCGDTLAMHLGIARGLRIVPIFGPTCEQEIDVYGRGEKIVTPISCAPCYKRQCDFNPTCQDEIPTSRVLEAVERQLEAVEGEKAGAGERAEGIGPIAARRAAEKNGELSGESESNKRGEPAGKGADEGASEGPGGPIKEGASGELEAKTDGT